MCLRAEKEVCLHVGGGVCGLVGTQQEIPDGKGRGSARKRWGRQREGRGGWAARHISRDYKRVAIS